MDRRSVRRLASLLVAFALASSAGCAVAVIGACAGAGTLGYMYYNGVLYRDYTASLAVTTQATKTALRQLEFPIVKEKTDTGTASIQTRTADGNNVTVYLNVVPSSIPAEGAVTRVGIRVGFSGDDVVSAKILDEVSRQISPSAGIAPAPPPVAKPPETPAPPLATTTTAGAKK